MKDFVVYEKCSKKEKRTRDTMRRGSWNGVVPSKKQYKRNPKHKSRACSDAWGSLLYERKLILDGR